MDSSQNRASDGATTATARARPPTASSDAEGAAEFALGYYENVGTGSLFEMNHTSFSVDGSKAGAKGGRLTPDEVKLFTKMLARIAAGEDHEVPIDVLRDDKGKLTNPQFAEFAKSLVDARWLAKAPDDDVVSYGPRSYLELADIIREHGVEVPQMITY